MIKGTQSCSQEAARQLWATLAAEGKAPAELTKAAEVLPAFSVGIEPWVDRVACRYLRNLCREAAHFKLVIAPYGGGKTHFLMAMGSRALEENFAVAYVACSPGISLDSPLDVYREFMKRLQLPGERLPGIRQFLERIIQHKRAQIEAAEAPDPDEAFEIWLREISREPYPENAFGRIVAEALRAEWNPVRATAGEAAVRWLQGDIDTLTREEMAHLRLAKIPAAAKKELGRNLLMSVIRFTHEAGIHGVVLLMDEVETLFSARGKALLRVLSAMRVLIDLPTGVPGGVPLLGMFSAVPDVREQLSKYPALQQRLAVRGAAFNEGNDLAPQILLEKLEPEERLLTGIGHKLVDLGTVATGYEFNTALQGANGKRLAKVAADRNLEVDARRLYIKAWVNILDLQVHGGEQEFSDQELAVRYQGYFDKLKDLEQEDDEP